MFFVLLLCAVGLVGANFQAPQTSTRKRYDGYKLFDVVPTTKSQLHILHQMMINDQHVDFWKEPSRVNQLVTFMVAPQHTIGVVTKLRRADIQYTVRSSDVEKELMAPFWNEVNARTPQPKVFNLNEYNILEDIYDWMENALIASCRPELTCETYDIGSSYEGRAMKIFKISSNGGGSNRLGFWFDATIHAREWITTATISNIMDVLARGANSDAIRLADAYDFYFLPVMNPDGYSYTWTDERLWRKNRRPQTLTCTGVDLNRNYDFRWGNEGVSHEPCQETYCGTVPASEQETQYVQNELLRLGSQVTALVTMHAYGNLFMFPWGNTINYEGTTCERSTDYDDLMLVADATANAIQATYNTVWTRGTSCEVIYATTGGTDDWAKGGAGIKYAYCPELRGNTFVVPPSQIPNSVIEVWNGIVAMIDTIAANQK